MLLDFFEVLIVRITATVDLHLTFNRVLTSDISYGMQKLFFAVLLLHYFWLPFWKMFSDLWVCKIMLSFKLQILLLTKKALLPLCCLRMQLLN